MSVRYTAVTLWCFVVTAVFAQDGGSDAVTDPSTSNPPAATIIVTARAPEEGIGPTPGVITIELERVSDSAVATLSEVIEDIPGLQLQRQGSRFESSKLRIRGSEAEQVLILRDGRILSDSRSAIVDVSHVSLAGVERIEIIYGPATALYGHGGAAGAINLITTTDPPVDSRSTGNGRLLWGSFGEVRTGVAVTIPFGDKSVSHQIDVEADGAYAENTYRFERNGEIETRDNAGGYDARGRTAYRRRAEKTETGFDAALSTYDRGLPGTMEFPASSATLGEQRVSVRGDFALRDTFDIEFGTARNARRFSDEEYPLGPLDAHSTLTAVDGGIGTKTVLGPFDLAVSVTGKTEILDDSELGDRRRNVLAVVPRVSTTVVIPTGSAVGLSGSGRAERIFGGDATARTLPSGRGSIDWTASRLPLWTGVAVSIGYRLPDFTELFTEGSAFAVGNDRLRPEESRGVEWEIRVGDRYVQPASAEIAPLVSTGLRVALFLTEYHDLIQWLPDPTGVWRPRNIDSAHTYGLESEGAIAVPVGLSPWDLAAKAGIEILQARDRSEGVTFDNQLPYRSQLAFHGEAALEHRFGHRLWMRTIGRGARPVTRQNTVWLDPYVDLSLGGRFAVVPDTAFLGVTIDNIRDERYVESRFYPNPGREIRVSLEVVW